VGWASGALVAGAPQPLKTSPARMSVTIKVKTILFFIFSSNGNE
jgi:hypothetical protein